MLDALSGTLTPNQAAIFFIVMLVACFACLSYIAAKAAKPLPSPTTFDEALKGLLGARTDGEVAFYAAALRRHKQTPR